MAKRTMDRRALRAQADAAERREGLEGEDTESLGTSEESSGSEPASSSKPKAKSTQSKPRKSKARVKTPTRMRVIFQVVDNSSKVVAKYPYAQRAEADAHAARLQTEKKITHFVMPMKEAIEE